MKLSSSSQNFFFFYVLLVFLFVALAIEQIFFISSLKSPFQTLNLPLVFLVWLVYSNINPKIIYFLFLFFSFFLALFSLLSFWWVFFLLFFIIEAGYILLGNVFTNRSLYSFLFLVALAVGIWQLFFWAENWFYGAAPFDLFLWGKEIFFALLFNLCWGICLFFLTFKQNLR